MGSMRTIWMARWSDLQLNLFLSIWNITRRPSKFGDENQSETIWKSNQQEFDKKNVKYLVCWSFQRIVQPVVLFFISKCNYCKHFKYDAVMVCWIKHLLSFCWAFSESVKRMTFFVPCTMKDFLLYFLWHQSLPESHLLSWMWSNTCIRNRQSWQRYTCDWYNYTLDDLV